MSGIASLFNYDIVVKRRNPDGTVDEENHPTEDGPPTTVATTRGAVQERSAREAAVLSQQGAVQSTHRVYLPYLPDVSEACYLEVAALGLTLSIVSVRDGGGREDHLEIDALEFRP